MIRVLQSDGMSVFQSPEPFLLSPLLMPEILISIGDVVIAQFEERYES